MAVASATDKIACNYKVTMYDQDDATATSANNVGWVDMRDYTNILVAVFTSALTGTGPTVFTLEGNTGAAGGGTDREIKAHAMGDLPNAVGDWVYLECSAEEIAQVGSDNDEDLRYVSAQVTCQHNDDEMVVMFNTGSGLKYVHLWT